MGPSFFSMQSVAGYHDKFTFVVHSTDGSDHTVLGTGADNGVPSGMVTDRLYTASPVTEMPSGLVGLGDAGGRHVMSPQSGPRDGL